MKNFVALFLIGCVSFMLSHPVLAQHVLPYFISGFWYADITFDDTFSCRFPRSYTYADVAKTTDKTEAAKTISLIQFAQSSYHPCSSENPCKCPNIQKVDPSQCNYLHAQSDFPGNENDAIFLFADDKQAPQCWSVYCENAKGDQAYFSLWTFPSYKCPVNSSFGFDAEDQTYGCSTEPICIADIIGRDITSDNVRGFLGDVGITEDEYSSRATLVEVLNNNEVINFGNIADFKTAGKFWGEKYQYPNLTFGQALNEILYNGLDNLLFNCPAREYSVDPLDVHPCQYDSKRGKEVAVLRCDYFVNYLYQQAGFKLIDFNPTTLPITLFNDLNYIRYEPAQKRMNNLSTDRASTEVIPNLTEHSQHMSWSLQERYIVNAFSQPQLDPFAIQITTYFSTNELIPRTEKIRFLWSLVQKNRKNEEAFNFLISNICRLYPIELIDNIFEEYKLQNSVSNRRVILDLLLPGLVSDPAKKIYEQEGLNTLAITNTAKIKRFFADLLSYEQDIDSLIIAVLDYRVIFEKEQYEQPKIDIDRVFQRPDIDVKKLKKKLFSSFNLSRNFFNEQLIMIFSNTSMQKRYLPVLIKNIEEENVITQTIFNICLYAFFTNELTGNDGFDSSKIDDSVRPLLLKYLETHRPAPFVLKTHISFENDEPYFLSTIKDRLQFGWVATYEAVQTHSMSEKYEKIANYISKTDNLWDKAVLIKNAVPRVLACFSTNELLNIKEALNTTKITKWQGTMYEVMPQMYKNRYIDAAILPIDKELKKRKI